MSTVTKPNTFSANTTISSSEINDNFDTIYNDYNGGISSANLAADSVTTAKIADSNVTTAKINAAAVTSAKINFGGSGAGVWWEEIARTTLSGAGDTITVSSIAARKYLMIFISVQGTGGTISVNLTFNGDSAANYAYRQSASGAADTTATAQNSLSLTGAATYANFWYVLDAINITAQEKLAYGRGRDPSTAGAGTAPARLEFLGKWANTSAQISSLTLTNAGTGDFAIGSEVVVLGHN